MSTDGTYESMEVLSMQIERIKNLLGAAELPMPPAFHLQMLKPALLEVAGKLRQVYVAETGDDPWKDAP